jgi:hypothetical protein
MALATDEHRSAVVAKDSPAADPRATPPRIIAEIVSDQEQRLGLEAKPSSPELARPDSPSPSAASNAAMAPSRAADSETPKPMTAEGQAIHTSDECKICFDTFDEAPAYPIPCGHYYFHEECLRKHFKPECPICRAPHQLAVEGEPPQSTFGWRDAFAALGSEFQSGGAPTIQISPELMDQLVAMVQQQLPEFFAQLNAPAAEGPTPALFVFLRPPAVPGQPDIPPIMLRIQPFLLPAASPQQ